MSMIKELLIQGRTRGASDIHIKSGSEPFFRVNGRLCESGLASLSEAQVREIIDEVIPPKLAESFDRTHESDFSFEAEEAGRFRVSAFMAKGQPCLALRHVKTEIPTFEQIRVPPQLKDMAQIERGIVLLAGTTSSGKSTTLAAIIGEMNRTQRRRIVTVEDPIEYVFEDDMSVITQREVGLDTLTFGNAITHLMRQDPDVILIGEMRDRDSISTALMAAETGHVVLSTLHSGTADQAISRMLDVFPSAEQDQLRLGIAANLHSVVCQRLVPDVAGSVVPAVEILINTSTVRRLIERGQLDTIAAAIETGKDDGMQSFNQSVFALIKEGLITEEEGMRYSTNPESLRMNLQGIFLDEDRRILGG